VRALVVAEAGAAAVTKVVGAEEAKVAGTAARVAKAAGVVAAAGTAVARAKAKAKMAKMAKTVRAREVERRQ